MKLVYFIFFLLNLSLVTCYSIFEDQNSVKVLKSLSMLEKAVNNPDFLSAVLYCSSSNPKCINIESTYIDYAVKVQGTIHVYALDCDKLHPSEKNKKGFFACSDSNLKNLPTLAFYEPSKNKTDPKFKSPQQNTEHLYHGSFALESLVPLSQSLMPNFADEIQTEHQFDQLLDDVIPNKVVLFYDNEKDLTIFKALASEYRDRIKFGLVSKDSYQIVQRFGIKNFPRVMIFKRNKERTHDKESFGDKYNFNKLKSFLKPLALPEKYVPHQDPEPIFTNLTLKNFEAVVQKEEGMVLVHMHTEESFPDLDQVLAKFKTMFTYFNLDCKSNKTQAYIRDILKVDTFPSLVVFPVGKKEDFLLIKHFPKFKKLIEIVHEVSEMIEDRTKSVRSNQLQTLITETLLDRKPIIVLFHEANEISMAFRALALLSKYKDKIVFANVKNPSDEIAKSFGINRLPSMIGIFLEPGQQEKLQIEPDYVRLSRFKGRYLYHEIEEFVETIWLYSKETSIGLTKEIQTQEDLKGECLSKTNVCAIALLNGFKESEEALQNLKKKVHTLDRISISYPDISFSWIDAVCHIEVLLSLNIPLEATPTIILYNLKEKAFIRMESKNFDDSHIQGFIQSYLKKPANLMTMSQEIAFKNKDCEAIHKASAKLKKSTEDSSTESAKKNKKKPVYDEL